ncbi:transcriptional regulator, TetR family [Lutibacter agarilyticus]|uniref:Transcriptional regulator, TetR family n=1 Tax=Lutibacter agarilyticus TaxID=1109740 RepID=A0A238XC97_9FLAO|nr:TetR/AcrR family transcriptional regulator [Lutibacter agarilyticus]SNR56222.1 transcriptional regulator, TetR family [Lutibacter agarilyticus]
MNNLKINIEVNQELYCKKPDSSDLGQKILSKSIEMINEIGFEAFTFKKLGDEIHSPESSIYRYFKNKHILLVYLTSWYWSWIEYELVFATTNIQSPEDRLLKCIHILTKPTMENTTIPYINESLLSNIIISESIKSYHTINVDEENKKGYFKSYKMVVQRVSDILLEIKPNFQYPHMLISTIIEGSRHQKYFAEHLPALTDVDKENDTIENFYKEMVLNFIK